MDYKFWKDVEGIERFLVNDTVLAFVHVRINTSKSLYRPLVSLNICCDGMPLLFFYDTGLWILG
jgi:hypothetical protein